MTEASKLSSVSWLLSAWLGLFLVHLPSVAKKLKWLNVDARTGPSPSKTCKLQFKIPCLQTFVRLTNSELSSSHVHVTCLHRCPGSQALLRKCTSPASTELTHVSRVTIMHTNFCARIKKKIRLNVLFLTSQQFVFNALSVFACRDGYYVLVVRR